MIDPKVRKSQKQNAPDSAYQAARGYWGAMRGGAIESFGVAPIGECGLAEVLYRDYEEFRHLSQIVDFARKSVLEIGSGNGRWALSLGPVVDYYEGVDFSPVMLDIARKRTIERGLANVKFVKAAAQNYTPARSFDVIYLSGVTQYLHDADLSKLLERLHSALNPGGVIVDRSTTHMHGRLVLERPDYFSIYRTGDEIVGLFGQAGWTNVYRQPSYRFLSFPEFLRRWVRTRKFLGLVAFTAPVSFFVLRHTTAISSMMFRPVGELLEFSHDFFLFRRSENHGQGSL